MLTFKIVAIIGMFIGIPQFFAFAFIFIVTGGERLNYEMVKLINLIKVY